MVVFLGLPDYCPVVSTPVVSVLFWTFQTVILALPNHCAKAPVDFSFFTASPLLAFSTALCFLYCLLIEKPMASELLICLNNQLSRAHLDRGAINVFSKDLVDYCRFLSCPEFLAAPLTLGNKKYLSDIFDHLGK